MISVVLVDDHPLMREGLTAKLEAEMDLEVTEAVGSAEEALELLEESRPDLLMTDLSLPEMDGLELTRRVANRWPELPVLMVSRHGETVYARDALKAGALGYIEKQVPGDQLVRAARRVAQGRQYLSEEVEGGLGLRTEEEGPAEIPTLLSERELRVFGLLGRGASMAEMADQMDLARKTVQSYIRRIKQKLEIGSTEEVRRRAVIWAEQDGS